MVFAVVGGTQDTGYDIDNSLRFNYPDNPQLSFTPSSDGNKRVATASFWLKRGVSRASNDLHIMGSQEDGSNLYSIRIRSSGNADVFQFLNAVSGSTSNGFTYKTNASFRDHSAWYHFVVAMDVTQSDGNNGLKLYVNGVLQTAYSISSYNQNVDVSFNTSGEAMKIGIKSDDSEPFDGYLADFHWIDGTQKQASDFGEYNDNGVWIPKKYDGSYGTNGFYLEFKQTGTSQNSSGIGADTSGNDNHFAVTNLAATDVTTDTPTNNFATMIPAPNLTISEGNLNFTHNRTSNWDGTTASMGVQNGKWYYEAKLTSTDASPRHNIGFAGNPETWTVVVDGKGGGSDPTSNMTNAYWFHSNTNSAGYLNKTDTYGSNVSQWGIASGDIVGVALDMDNQKIYFHKNGTYYGADGNSSDPTNGTNPAYSSITTGIHYRPFLMLRNDGSETNTISMNFGNPVYAISSGNTDGLYGNFEYAPPSGYYSLCTKNLARYG